MGRGRARAAGLRLRLTLLATGLVALASGLLLWLGWVLVGTVVATTTAFPAGATVRIGEIEVPAEVARDTVAAAARSEVLRAGLIAFPLVVLAGALVSWMLIGRVLAPLHQVIAAARRLSASSLDERVALRRARGEVAELAAGFDAMLDRLQAAFEAQRRFVANAGHELRTPLAVLRTEIDVTLQDPDADVAELRRMGEVVRDAGRRCDELVAGLLLLARTEASGPLGEADRVPVNLAELLVSELDGVSAVATEHGLSVRADPVPAHTRGDEVLLRRLVANLVENAVRHNRDGGWIEAATGTQTGGTRAGDDAAVVELRVSSTGPELAADQVAELFEPFRRGPVARTARTRGSGLGLSIVRAVAAAHDATVDAVPVPGGGLEVRVRFSSALPSPGPSPGPPSPASPPAPVPGPG
ncbi:MAG: HAMP domain-containing histidine kinase [Pseudonocardia sp.]|nr:HAMP domain-containing histidine kinase [Pseudonocardia sp.]